MSPLCSRNARSQKTLVGRAQWGTHPSHPVDNIHERTWADYLESLAVALLGTRRVLENISRQCAVGKEILPNRVLSDELKWDGRLMGQGNCARVNTQCDR